MYVRVIKCFSFFQLSELEERAEELDKKRTSSIATVALINDRNRKANVSKAEEAIRKEIIRKKIEGEESNPFVRRKCNPRMVTKPSIQSSEDLQRALAAAAEKENQEKAAKAAAVAEAERTMKGRLYFWTLFWCFFGPHSTPVTCHR